MSRSEEGFQNWRKLGRIIDAKNYRAVPIARIIEDKLEIVYSTRNELGFSLPQKAVIRLDDFSILDDFPMVDLTLGGAGDFDEHGVMPCSILRRSEREVFMYYIGWNTGGSTPFRNALGLAISEDNGRTYRKYSSGPILDRNPLASKFVASCEVIQHEGKFLMWYLACNEWIAHTCGMRHKYDINYAESTDGINWSNGVKSVITFQNDLEYAFSTPRVLFEDDVFKMWYSYRATKKSSEYIIGYAESLDGITWARKDSLVGLHAGVDTWDDKMICYPSLFYFQKDLYMLYNGNDYGKNGVGLAKLENNEK